MFRGESVELLLFRLPIGILFASVAIINAYEAETSHSVGGSCEVKAFILFFSICDIDYHLSCDFLQFFFTESLYRNKQHCCSKRICSGKATVTHSSPPSLGVSLDFLYSHSTFCKFMGFQPYLLRVRHLLYVLSC